MTVGGTTDIAVIGGGIVGMACAAELALREPRLRVVVLEREPELASTRRDTTVESSTPASTTRRGRSKARLCTEGARLMYEFCEAHGIIAERVGKLIIARDASELPRLRAILDRGRRNGVAPLHWLEGSEIAAIEPSATGVAAIHLPGAGITDYAAVTHRLADVVRERGGEVLCGISVDR